MSRFKVGQTVFSGRGSNLRELVVARVHKNHLLPIRQYAFEAPNDGFLSGEQSLRSTADGKDLKMSDCFVDDKETETRINTIAAALRGEVDAEPFGLKNTFANTQVDFKPSLEMCKWLVKHANGRLIIHVGSGQGHLVNMLKMAKGKVLGIEPHFNIEKFLEFRSHRDGQRVLTSVNEILPRRIEDCKKIIRGLGSDKALLLFARPKSGDYVRRGILDMPVGMEALYIARPVDIQNYNDLGIYEKRAKLIEHEGISQDDEVVYSITK